MPRGSEVYLEDILESIRRIEIYTRGTSYEDFEESLIIQDAVCRNLAIIGEAVRKLPEELTSQRPEIEWHKIAGLRNILIHEYAGVDLRIVWDVVQSKLTGLRVAARELRG